jgi:hypothetical protein
MPIPNDDQIEIPYGAGLSVTIDRRARAPLRLNTMRWAFPEPPDLIRLTGVDERLDFLRDHLKSLCGLWDKLPRAFLDVYFCYVAVCIERNRANLATCADPLGGLFQPEDWSYSALCPLPRAHLPAIPESPVDFAFWTGETLYAIEIAGHGTPSRGHRDERVPLRAAGVPVIEIPGAGLAGNGVSVLAALLPAPFTEFWKSQPLPSSPFRIGALDRILPA